MGLGVEKRVKGIYGDKGDKSDKAGEQNGQHNQNPPFSHVAGYLALLLSFIALVTIIIIYTGSDLGQVGAIRQNLNQTQAQVEALNAQIRTIERRSELGQQAVIDSLIVDVTSKIRYLAEQPLTSEQRQELREALATAAPDQEGQTIQPQETPPAGQPGTSQ
jgi:hypothetical protein